MPDVRLHRVLVNSGDLASNNQTQGPAQRCRQTEGAAQAEGTGGRHQRRCAVSSPSGETCTTRRAWPDLSEPEDDLDNLQIRRAPAGGWGAGNVRCSWDGGWMSWLDGG